MITITRQIAESLVAECHKENKNALPIEIGDRDVALAAFVAAFKFGIAEEVGFFPNSLANANVLRDATGTFFSPEAQKQCDTEEDGNTIVNMVRAVLLEAAGSGNCTPPTNRNAAAVLAVSLRKIVLPITVEERGVQHHSV